jgi:hypothetical protein
MVVLNKHLNARRVYMSNKAGLVRRNLSLFAFIAIYLVIATVLLFLESFQPETQGNVITTLFPFFLLGIILDYIASKNHDLSKGYLIFSQLLPTGVFLIFGISIILDITGRPPIDALNYIMWLFIAVPFFITSNIRENYRRRMLTSFIGTGLIGAVYIQLTTKADELDKENGLIVYLICIFLIFYAASGLKKLFFSNIILGFIDGALLIFLRLNPITYKSRLYGWDYDIAYQFELLLLANFIICIILCLIKVLKEEIKKK